MYLVHCTFVYAIYVHGKKCVASTVIRSLTLPTCTDSGPDNPFCYFDHPFRTTEFI